ncbi:DNA-processing protein DprA [Sphingomonas mesophila]|uniref:DNA-processing protein DprA n=1 Tax=Sphingomonas mesophila TaxID=2303576 RepID=UPI001F07E426|nr:DNA-processing protein DprA [Sphingomonas mesophila]
MNADLLARLRLVRSQGIGPITFRQLLMRFGSAEAALAAVPDLAARGGGRPPVLYSAREAEAEVAAVEAFGAKFLSVGQGLYPRALAELDSAPPVLIVKGDQRLLERTMVGMVGARNASAAACRFARGLATELGREGIVVVSGLARGIDTAAHDGAMDSGTVGCAAGGVDIFYPPENRERQQRMSETGLVVSERRLGHEPRAKDFPRRNRIIAGLGQACVVIEAAPRSGSLITARMAAEAGREVMAVPGSPLDPRAQGCNQLIRDGATLVQSAADVMEELRPAGHFASPGEPFAAGEPAPVDASADVRCRVIELLGPSPAPVDEIVRLSGASPGEVQLVLLELDLGGRLDRHAGGKVSLTA